MLCSEYVNEHLGFFKSYNDLLLILESSIELKNSLLCDFI